MQRLIILNREQYGIKISALMQAAENIDHMTSLQNVDMSLWMLHTDQWPSASQ